MRFVLQSLKQGDPMEKVNISLEVPKELKEVSDALLKIVVECKKALADGFQLGQDVPVVISQCAGPVLVALEGVGKISEEISGDRKAALQSIILGLLDVADEILKK